MLRKLHTLTLLTCAGLLIAACGDSELRLSTDKAEISAGGVEFATISARVVINDDARKNAKVSFETSAGSFDSTAELTNADAATGSDGVATIKLYSASKPGPATVTATYSDDEAGIDLTATLAVTFTSAAAAVVDGRITFACKASNIGALRAPVPDIKVRCTLTAQTRDGQTISASALAPEFRTEAGSITPREDDSGERIFIYSPKGGGATPKDVPPNASLGEPSYNDLNGIQRNPRDGLATLIAIVEGEEDYQDVNGNGRYDQGEPFTDTAEPWVDADDDDKRGSTEEFIDTNGNGQWDPGNARWDSRVKLMAIYKILWTGKVDNSSDTSRIQSFSTDIFDGGSTELKAHLLDANLNPIAAFPGASDNVTWLLIGDEATTYDDTEKALDNVYGFAFDQTANTDRKRWRILSNSFRPQPHSLTVEDGYPQDGTPARTSWTVTVKAHTSAGPDGEGGYLDQRTEDVGEKVVGTCD